MLGYALELELIETNPVHVVRETVRRKARSKQGRAEAEQKAHPIEEPENIAAILDSTRMDGIKPYANVLLQLDAGLRVGEAGGLCWKSIEWGEGNRYKGRALNIVANRPRGGPSEKPKSGRERRVDLSLRLRDALEELKDDQKVPGPGACVLAGLNQDNFRKYAWQNIIERAGVGHRNPSDLRDTFASQLLTVGIQLGYISNAIGHADVSITARHYARYIPRDGYRTLEPRAGELPPDLLARLAT